MARGNERSAIYLDDRDRDRFLKLLGKTVRRHRWQCLAYCLMGNHYHLVVRTPLPNLSLGMRILNGGYAAGFNTRHDRVGHLFQGRFRGVLIGTSEHLRTAIRYVLRNPVEEGLCMRPEDWRWSSYRATVGGAPADLVATEATLAVFGDNDQAPQRFAKYVVAPVVERVGALPPSVAFPSDPTSTRNGDRPSMEGILARHPGTGGIAIAHRDYGYSLGEIAIALGVGASTVGRRLVAHESAEMLERATWPRGV